VHVRRRILAVVAALAAGALLPLPAAAVPPLPIPMPPELQEALGCDPLDPSLCLLPFPNDAFTVTDASTATGRRVDFAPSAMPRNGADLTAGSLGGEGLPVDPTEWNRNDGFSPGQPVLTHVPDLDLHRTWGTTDRPHSTVGENEPGYFDHRDHIADIDLYRRPGAPIVILNADTGERHPFWSELDLHDGTPDDRRALILRPARNFDHGGRYIVALRNLRDAGGNLLPAREEFAALRDGTATGPRAEHLQRVLATLEAAGIGRQDLYLAWDFTVASSRNLAERMLHIRDDAFGRILGDPDLADFRVQGASPAFTVEQTEDRTDTWRDASGVERTQQVRRVRGTVTVPNYLDRPQQLSGELPLDPPAPGSRFYREPGADLPSQNPLLPEVAVPFVCDVPLGQGPSYGTLYGHGLLGSRDQIGDVKWPRRYGFAGCSADWWGMSTVDLPTVALILADLSNFPSLPDRAQQGFLNFLFLGRAMVHPQGFVSDPTFRDESGELLVVDRGEGTHLYYDGNSQGGIMGGSLVAVSPDISRGILGVPAMNYSTLLNRSVDWEGAYGEAYYLTYQDPIERQLGFGLIQMLWDRGEANGYAAHMTGDPLPNTPPHEVMLQVAYSDHQVTVHAAEVEAATIGAPVMAGLPDERHWARERFNRPTPYPYRGSALIYWDSGNATPPNGNRPATHARDPHGDPRNEPAAGWQEAHFLLTGWNVDVCGGGDYVTQRHLGFDGWTFCVEPAEAPGAGGPVLPVAGPALERVAGPDRIATAVAVSQRSFTRASRAVLARADDFPDALAASALAAEVEGPVMLTGRGALAPAVADELARLGTTEVYLVGGSAALSVQVASDLQARGISSRRLAGPDRFGTAVAIAREVVRLGGAVERAVLARADAFPDALAAGNVAVAGRAPILLTPTAGLHPATRAALGELLGAGQPVVLAGGTAAVSAVVEQEIAAAGFTPRRVAGANRFATAAALADEARRLGASASAVVLASGGAFPDALAAAPAAGRLGGVLLLVHPGDLASSGDTRTWLQANAGRVRRIVVAGGTAAVADRVAEAARAAR
jgi:putative cell wall-binding protein